MNLEDLQQWILSPDGMAPELSLLSRFAAAKSLGLPDPASDLSHHQPNWKRLLFAGSILSLSKAPNANEFALMIAQAGLLNSELSKVADASATLLTQLANHRAVQLAIQRGRMKEGLEDRVGTSEQMLLVRRQLQQSIFTVKGPTITTNRFQRDFWDQLQRAAWVSASAPTASGKTYLVLQWLLNEFALGRAQLAVFLAPTRALVGEIERDLLDLSLAHQVNGIRIASLPLAALGDRSRPTILVFTQERLHVFLNSAEKMPKIDIAIVDEVHKLGDGLRGVILQDAIERVVRSNDKYRLIFLSPMTENPEVLIEDAPKGLATAVIPSELPTVTQNLIIAEQMPIHSDRWRLLLRRNGNTDPVGEINLLIGP
jgi:hypothetical protein